MDIQKFCFCLRSLNQYKEKETLWTFLYINSSSIVVSYQFFHSCYIPGSMTFLISKLPLFHSQLLPSSCIIIYKYLWTFLYINSSSIVVSYQFFHSCYIPGSMTFLISKLPLFHSQLLPSSCIIIYKYQWEAVSKPLQGLVGSFLE